MKCITSNRRNKILNQKHLIYFFCLIIILFFITIKNKEHHFSCGSAVGGDRLSTSSLQTQGEWFIYSQNITF